MAVKSFIGHGIDRIFVESNFLSREAGGIMKARPGKTAIARRFYSIFVLLLTLAAWTSSSLAVEQGEPARQSSEQTTAQPSASPDSAGVAQQAPQAPEAAKTRQEEITGQQPVGPAPAAPEQALQVPAEQPAPPEAKALPPAAESASSAPVPVAAQLPAPPVPQLSVEAAPKPEAAAINCPPEYVPLIQKTTTALMTANFTFYPIKALDPFVPFVTPDTQARLEEGEQKSEQPLTPLQKMTLTEIERGLKAISWGELGTRAVIEDSTGRGYIVTVGTPAGERSGVITQILNDRLVIQQEIWDRKARKRFPQDFTIKLSKKTDNTR